jgi:hypothetical protein
MLAFLTVCVLVFVLFYHQLAANFLPSAVGSLLGVLVGFGVNRWWDDRLKGETQTNLLSSLHDELNYNKDRLGRDERGELKIHLLKREVWEGATASGLTTSLLESNVLIQLATRFFSIGVHNHDAERIRDLAEAASEYQGEAKAAIERRREMLKATLEKFDENLAKDIEATLKEDFWPKPK